MVAKKEQKNIAFEFQEIDLAEAQDAVIAGDGNYAGVKVVILEMVRKLAPGKALAFGLPSGKEVDEESRRGICAAVNKTLKHGGLAWRVTYSGMKKLFILLPKDLKPSKQLPGSTKIPSVGPGTDFESLLAQTEIIFNIPPGAMCQPRISNFLSSVRSCFVYFCKSKLFMKYRDMAKVLGLKESNLWKANRSAARHPEIYKKLEESLNKGGTK